MELECQNLFPAIAEGVATELLLRTQQDKI